MDTHIPAQPSSDPSSPQRGPRARATSRFVTWRHALIGVALLLLVAVIVWISSGSAEQETQRAALARVPGAQSIQVEVQNASGSTGLAQRAADGLRARGFDVVDYGTDRSRIVQRTVVLDRRGNSGAAQRVAEALGLPAERVAQRIDRRLMLDVTVVLGKDAPSLGAIRPTAWRESE